VKKNIDDFYSIMKCIWDGVKNKWPVLFNSDIEKLRIIQGSIGFTSINRFISKKLKKSSKREKMDTINEIIIE
jgi:hypothetical protein